MNKYHGQLLGAYKNGTKIISHGFEIKGLKAKKIIKGEEKLGTIYLYE